MSDVYRYDLSLPTNAKNFGMRLSENGCWVEHESYAALEAERDQLRAERDALRASIAALADEWDAIAKRQRYQAEMDSRRDYADSAAFKDGRASGYESCARELRQLAEGNSAAAQEGL